MINARHQIILIASFNAERFWRAPDYSTLPSFKDEQANRIVEAMDELQFTFCDSYADLSVTKFPMNEAHLTYLNRVGLLFSNIGLASPLNKSDDDQPTGSLLYQNFKEVLNRLNTTALKAVLNPYAIVNDPYPLTGLLLTNTAFPGLEVVKKVNSKVYSTKLSQQLETGFAGLVVNSCEQLQLQANLLLKSSEVLIKDPYGVSGSGNLLIKKPSTLKSIIKHLQNQEQAGKKTEFIIEPYLDKAIDFSCQAVIDEKGNVNIVSVQIMENDKFRFSGIVQADEAFIKKIESQYYFAYVELIAKALYNEGYWGPFCIDSMILVNGDLIPVIEINARKSMGFINNRLFKFLMTINKKLKSKMMTLLFITSQKVSFELLLTHLRQCKLLFTVEQLYGIIPLSANTVDINSHYCPDTPYKGRLYYQLVYTTTEELNALQAQINELFKKLSLIIL